MWKSQSRTQLLLSGSEIGWPRVICTPGEHAACDQPCREKNRERACLRGADAAARAQEPAQDFLVEHMDGLLGKHLFLVVATTLAALIMAPHEAEAIPSFITDAISKFIGRNEENDE
ncbi:uncharacterized protein [Dermacentor albipictus]|uniref:uncharacterized protein n=1 Tax=Dermacentor albipictus TaxID=60249 RepID=UPI0031FCE63C